MNTIRLRAEPAQSNSPRRGHTWTRWPTLLILAIALWAGLSARAYPPSPYYFIYGLVRDPYGQPLMNSQATILMVTTNGVQNLASLHPELAIGVNYQIQVPMDALFAPDLYRSNALPAGTGFRLYVVIGNITNAPIVSVGSSTNLGQPAQISRIDLSLGTDSNGDGIPDEWELALLATIGSNLTLADLNASTSLLGDGHTLYQDFMLGLDPFNPTAPFAVSLVNLNGGAPLLEFPVLGGLTYSILGSTNLQQWAAQPFKLPSEGPSAVTRTNYTPSLSQTLQIQVVRSGPGPAVQFFRVSSP